MVQGILEAQPGDVLVVDAKHSDRAIAGELLAAEAQRGQLGGLVILNGYMRDTVGLAQLTDLACFAHGVTPYAGTCLHPATMQCTLTYSTDKIQIGPGDIMVGDKDGLLLGSADTLNQILPIAQEIHGTESIVRARQREGESLASLCNIEEHLSSRKQGKESQFKFNI